LGNMMKTFKHKVINNNRIEKINNLYYKLKKNDTIEIKVYWCYH